MVRRIRPRRRRRCPDCQRIGELARRLEAAGAALNAALRELAVRTEAPAATREYVIRETNRDTNTNPVRR